MLYMPGTCNGRVRRCCHIESGFTHLLCHNSNFPASIWDSLPPY